MALQSQRRTKSSKKRRASHFALKKQSLAKCLKCGKPVRPHHACDFCGNYKGKEAVKVKSKSAKILAEKKKMLEKAEA
ncbi:50S ribosomal protein L32 [Candidatus Falkowbacteria bacterium RBG_13_39_14]|uniref:Large ribosomal subunit protein bL32 n=1 Tax=Candidatus Falkowbacteria bacterium RBG_13_39_14 TaxID=1797985 RepID=A0A1F5S5K0_9BACT|nr:MAG: 50S ribosomal protein L32 [Candidatus Falkowbacteria bacterium RBG_13_39_14]